MSECECVCVCVRERETHQKNAQERERERAIFRHLSVNAIVKIYINAITEIL